MHIALTGDCVSFQQRVHGHEGQSIVPVQLLQKSTHTQQVYPQVEKMQHLSIIHHTVSPCDSRVGRDHQQRIRAILQEHKHQIELAFLAAGPSLM